MPEKWPAGCSVTKKTKQNFLLAYDIPSYLTLLSYYMHHVFKMCKMVLLPWGNMVQHHCKHTKIFFFYYFRTCLGLSDYHTGRTLWTTSRHPFERAVPRITCNFMQELYRLSTIPLVTPSEGKGVEALETYFELLCVHNIWGTFRRVPRGSQEGSASVADWGIPNAASSLLFIFMLNVAPCCLRVIKHLSSLHKFLQMRWILLKGWLREKCSWLHCVMVIIISFFFCHGTLCGGIVHPRMKMVII